MNVHILLDGGIQERCVNVLLAQFEIHGGGDGNENMEDGHSDDKGEDLCVVEAGPLDAAIENIASVVT
jgi:hypothetical protein